MRIKYTGANVLGLGTDAVLVPGENNVPDDVLQKWANNPRISDLIKRGVIDEVEPSEAPAPRKPKAKAKADATEQPPATEPTEPGTPPPATEPAKA